MQTEGPGPEHPRGRHHDNATAPPPEAFANPAGVGGQVCDTPDEDDAAEPCDPTEVEDLVMEEKKPGYGISGYEGEEVGGG